MRLLIHAILMISTLVWVAPSDAADISKRKADFEKALGDLQVKVQTATKNQTSQFIIEASNAYKKAATEFHTLEGAWIAIASNSKERALFTSKYGISEKYLKDKKAELEKQKSELASASGSCAVPSAAVTKFPDELAPIFSIAGTQGDTPAAVENAIRYTLIGSDQTKGGASIASAEDRYIHGTQHKVENALTNAKNNAQNFETSVWQPIIDAGKIAGSTKKVGAVHVEIPTFYAHLLDGAGSAAPGFTATDNGEKLDKAAAFFEKRVDETKKYMEAYVDNLDELIKQINTLKTAADAAKAKKDTGGAASDQEFQGLEAAIAAAEGAIKTADAAIATAKKDAANNSAFLP